MRAKGWGCCSNGWPRSWTPARSGRFCGSYRPRSGATTTGWRRRSPRSPRAGTASSSGTSRGSASPSSGCWPAPGRRSSSQITRIAPTRRWSRRPTGCTFASTTAVAAVAELLRDGVARVGGTDPQLGPRPRRLRVLRQRLGGVLRRQRRPPRPAAARVDDRAGTRAARGLAQCARVAQPIRISFLFTNSSARKRPSSRPEPE